MHISDYTYYFSPFSVLPLQVSYCRNEERACNMRRHMPITNTTDSAHIWLYLLFQSSLCAAATGLLLPKRGKSIQLPGLLAGLLMEQKEAGWSTAAKRHLSWLWSKVDSLNSSVVRMAYRDIVIKIIRVCLFVCLLAGCLTSQQHASVSQGRICSDNFTCCHTEIEAADQTFHLNQSQYWPYNARRLAG